MDTTDTQEATGLPPVVNTEQWEEARAALLVEEKAATRMLDALAAERRRLPMVAFPKPYVFTGADGPASLLDLFEGRRQLVLYNFMFAPGTTDPCEGCSMLVDNMGHPAHLHARDTSRVLVSRAPLPELLAYRERMGWTIPWYSSFGTDFNDDVGATVDGHETFRLNVFLRDGDDAYRTYVTAGRGGENVGSNWTYLDLTPFGRQEAWEDSPAGRPQGPPYAWWRRHDEYA